jgi:hypothetical protein
MKPEIYEEELEKRR